QSKRTRLSPRPSPVFAASLRGCASLLCSLERVLGLHCQRGKTCCVVRGDVGQDLAVQTVASLLQAIDERRVAHAIDLARSIDAHDPQRAELALLLLAADVGKLQSALNSFLSGLVQLGFREEV